VRNIADAQLKILYYSSAYFEPKILHELCFKTFGSRFHPVNAHRQGNNLIAAVSIRHGHAPDAGGCASNGDFNAWDNRTVDVSNLTFYGYIELGVNESAASDDNRE